MEKLGNTQNHQAAYADEIDLVDILVFFLRNLKTIILITAVFTLIGLVVSLLLPRQYSYTTAIEIGTLPQGREGTLEFVALEDPGQVQEMFKSAIIPNTLSEQTKAAETHKLITLKASSPKKSNIVVLSSKGTLEASKRHINLHNQSSNILLALHNQKQDSLRQFLATEIKTAGIQLERATNSRIPDIETASQKQDITRLRATQHRKTSSEGKLSMPTNDRNGMSRLTIPELEQYILRRQILLRNIQPTRIAKPASPSIKPVSPGVLLITLISLILGVFIATMATIFKELLNQAQARLAQT